MLERSHDYISKQTMTPSTMENNCPVPDNYALNVDSNIDNNVHEEISFDEASFATTGVNKTEIGIQTHRCTGF